MTLMMIVRRRCRQLFGALGPTMMKASRYGCSASPIRRQLLSHPKTRLRTSRSSLIETLVVGAVLEWPLASPDGDSSPLLSELGDGSTEPLWSHRDDYEIFQIPAMDFNLLSCAERFGFRKTQLAPILNQRRYGVFMEYRSTLAKKLSRLSKEELALCVPPSHRIETWDEAEDIKHMVDFLTQPRLSFRGASHDFGLSMVSDVFVALGDSPWVANNIGRKVKTIHVYATLPGRTAQVYDDSDVATRWCEQQKTDDYAWAPECKVMTEADTYLTEKGMFYRSSQQTLPLFEINYEWRPEKECQLNAYAMKVRALADDAVYANKHPERVTSSVL